MGYDSSIMPPKPTAPTPSSHLLFVYNADSGLFNALADIGHKLFSPSTYGCDLCFLTHGLLREKARWKRFVETLPLPCQFLHRDQFRQRYPGDTTPLPAIFRVENGQCLPCIGAAQLRHCTDLDQLEEWIRQACLANHPPAIGEELS